MPWSIKGLFIHKFFLSPTTPLTDFLKPVLYNKVISFTSLEYIINFVNPHPLPSMEGSGQYGDTARLVSELKDYVKAGKSHLSRQGHGKMNQHFHDEYPGSTGGYPGDPWGRETVSGVCAEAELAGRNDGNDLPTLIKSRAKLKAELGALNKQYSGTDKAKVVIMARLEMIKYGIERLESGQPQDYADEASHYQPRGSRHGHQFPSDGHGHPGVEDYVDERSHYQPRESHHGRHPPPAGHSRPGPEDYVDERSHYQPRESHHGRHPPPAGHSRPSPEDYADEESDYKPRSSRHSHLLPPAGHGRRAGR